MKIRYITAAFGLLFGICSCGSKGLDNKDNQQEKEHHENFIDSTKGDSNSTGSVNFELKFANTVYSKTYYKQ